MEWSRDLDLNSLVSANCWASLEEMEKVVPHLIDEFKYVVEKCKCFPLHEVPLQSLTFATRFVAVFLFRRVKSARPMTFQHLTVSMFQNYKANNEFIDQKDIKTNFCRRSSAYLRESLRCMLSMCVMNPENDYLLLTRNGTQYKNLGMRCVS